MRTGYDVAMRRLLALDVLVVVLFVILGRETHNEGNALADIAVTAAPFLMALVAGWAIAQAWREPLDLRRGAVVAVVTVALGMILRNLVFDEGTALPFVIVATLFNLGGMVAWRFVAGRVVRRRSPLPTG